MMTATIRTSTNDVRLLFPLNINFTLAERRKPASTCSCLFQDMTERILSQRPEPFRLQVCSTSELGTALRRGEFARIVRLATARVKQKMELLGNQQRDCLPANWERVYTYPTTFRLISPESTNSTQT